MPKLFDKFLDISSKNDTWSNGLNIVAIASSLTIFSAAIYEIDRALKKNDSSKVRSWSIVLSVSIGLGVIIKLLDLDFFINNKNKESKYSWEAISKFFLLSFCSFPYFIMDGLMYSTNSIIGDNKGKETMGLKELNNKYGGRINQVKNLGKIESDFMFLNSTAFRYTKRESILPCKTAGVKGICQVRRSVIYMIFYLSAILLVPLFITLGNLNKNDDKKIDRDEYTYYFFLFSTITIGAVITFVLSTVKSTAGREVFGDTDIKKGVEAVGS
jgi:hypothetical protein